jgi:hypothetical protein
MDYICANINDEEFMEGWLASQDIFKAPWFTRVWIFQEFIVATNLHFMYSGTFASRETLLPVWMTIFSHVSPLTTDDYFWNISKHTHQNCPKRRNLRRVKRHVRRNEEMKAIDRMRLMIKSRASFCGSMDLKKLLQHSRNCNTSNPRDRIFAFVGLADSAYDIIPNYSHTIDRVLTDATINIIKTECSLEVLWHAVVSQPRRNCNLPSWVVDWICEEDPDHPYVLFAGLQQDEFNASFYALNTSIGVLRALEVDGVCLDRLGNDPGSSVKAGFSHRSLQGFLVVCSDLARHNDGLWAFNGCGVLLVLRAEQDYGYKLISAAALHDRYGNGIVQARREEHGGWQGISII